MNSSLPENPRQLRGMLVRRLSVAAALIGLAAGTTFHLLEARRVESASLNRAEAGARHFESPAMRMALGADAPGEHAALANLLDRTHFVAIRVFGANGALVYESWQDIPSVLRDAVRSHRHDWPTRGQSHRQTVDIAGERLILVVLPLTGSDGRVVGYVESVNRLDQQALQEQRIQVRSATLAAVASVLVTASVLYPMLLAMLNRSSGLFRNLLNSNLSLLRSLGNAVAKRDAGTDAHNYRVTLYAVALAEALALPEREIAGLVAGAFLHDVGKIGIPDRILLKPGQLTAEEFEIMKTHVSLGLAIVADNPWLQSAVPTIRHHHERFDGSGYPDGRQGVSIPRQARIFAVVDVFDALTSNRPYRSPMTFEDALLTVERESGRHFDPQVVAAFKGIGPALYADFHNADDSTLRGRLQEVLSRYFTAEGASERAPNCSRTPR